MPRERKEETMNAAWLDAAFAPVCANSYRTACGFAKRAMSAPSRSPPLPAHRAPPGHCDLFAVRSSLRKSHAVAITD
jgi:hypothetical protein